MLIGQSVTTRQAELALFVLVMQQKWHNQSLLEALWNRYNMQVGKTYNRNLENCIPFTRHITAQEAMRAARRDFPKRNSRDLFCANHAVHYHPAGGTGTICVSKVAQPVPVGSPLDSVQYACKKPQPES